MIRSIGIVGQGFVGSSIKSYFSSTTIDVHTFDLNGNCNCKNLEELVSNSEFIFIPNLLFDLMCIGLITPPKGLAPSGIPSPLKELVWELKDWTEPFISEEWIFTKFGLM